MSQRLPHCSQQRIDEATCKCNGVAWGFRVLRVSHEALASCLYRSIEAQPESFQSTAPVTKSNSASMSLRVCAPRPVRGVANHDCVSSVKSDATAAFDIDE